MKQVAIAGVLGLGAGFIGGLFGVGGGIVMVPGLVLWMGMTQHRAHGTSVAAIVASASAAAVPFAIDSQVDWQAAALILIGALAGASVGARFMGKIPAVWLARSFLLLTLAAAARIALVA